MLKTPITYYGGKQNLLSQILPLIPEHDRYTEAFVGGGAVYFAKPKVKLEVVNDTNQQLITFYRVAQEKFPQLRKKVLSTLHSRALHKQAWVIYNNPDLFSDVDTAWAVWVLATQGFSAKLAATWGYDKSASTMTKKIQNNKLKFTAELQARLEGTQVECTDAIKVIKTYDSPTTFHYVDPPYFNSNCGHYDGYSEADFVELLYTLAKVEGKFLLSSYPSEVLEGATKSAGWHTIKIKKQLAVQPGAKGIKTEVLTANFPLK